MTIPFALLEEHPEEEVERLLSANPIAINTQQASAISVANHGLFFSHGPPTTIQGQDRWPGCPDHQASFTSKLSLIDVWVHLQCFLSACERKSIQQTSREFSLGTICSPLWLSRPWQPHRRRRWGFGRASINRSATTNQPTFFHVFHHILPFMDPFLPAKCQSISPFLLR